MTMRQTPFQRIRYPWTTDTVNVADVQSMGADIDQALVQTATMAANFSRFSSVIAKRSGSAQSVAKGTLTTVSFDSVQYDNGASSATANGLWWNAGNPTRLTAPAPCIVMAVGNAMINFTSSPGTPAVVQGTISINGQNGSPGVQGGKYTPVVNVGGQNWVPSILSMWKMAAGDYLEWKVYWTGTPTGPFNLDTGFPASLSVAVVALPSVP